MYTGAFQPALKLVKGNNTTSSLSARSSFNITIFRLIIISSSFLTSCALYNKDLISYRVYSRSYTSNINTFTCQSKVLQSPCSPGTWRSPWQPPWSAPLPVLAVLVSTLQSLHKSCWHLPPHEITMHQVEIYSQPRFLNQTSYCGLVQPPRINLSKIWYDLVTQVSLVNNPNYSIYLAH